MNVTVNFELFLSQWNILPDGETFGNIPYVGILLFHWK